MLLLKVLFSNQKSLIALRKIIVLETGMDSFRSKVTDSFSGLSYGLYAALVTRLALTTVYQSVRVSV